MIPDCHTRVPEPKGVKGLSSLCRLQIIGQSSHLIFFAHLFCCVAAILARPAALILLRLLRGNPRFNGAAWPALSRCRRSISASISSTIASRSMPEIIGASVVAAGIELKEYAACRTVLPFKYRPIVAQRVHHCDATDRNWFLALPLAGSRWVNRATHSLPPLTSDVARHGILEVSQHR